MKFLALVIAGVTMMWVAAAGADAPPGAGAIVGGKDEDAITEIMNGIKEALGVQCTHCHVRKEGKFDYKKWTGHKRIALWMYVNVVQKMKNADGSALTCNNCHNGKAKFLKKIEKGG
jgi:hypothetical protein